MVVGTITKDSFALASHSHALADLPKLEAGTLIMGTGSSTALGTLARGANGQFLSVVSNQLAWVDAPSGSSVSPANPTASVGLTAVNGTAATFMRSDAAPKLDVSISPTWTGTHTFNGPCQFNGGTNLTGRVRNFLNLSAGTTLTPPAGTDLLVFFERADSITQTLTFPATNMAGRAGDIIRVILCGNCKLTFSTGSGNPKIKPAYYGATANDNLTTQSTTGDWMFICDGTNWRAQMLPQLFE